MTHDPNCVRPVASRRAFLKAGAAAVAGAALARTRLGGSVLLAADAPAAGDPFGGLKMGIQSYTLRDRPYTNMLDAMQKDLKLHYVELFPSHRGFQAAKPAEMLELLKAHDVTALSYGVVSFSKDDAANRKLFETAKAFGMTNLSCDPSPDSFDSLDKLTEEFKITAAIHPHGPDGRGGMHRWAKIDTIQSALKDHSKMIGLCADTGHLIRAGEDPMRALEVFKGRTYSVHLKDFKKLDGDRWEDVPATEGSLDANAVVKFLLDQKYAGGVFIEYEGQRPNDPTHPVTATEKSLRVVRDAVKKAKA